MASKINVTENIAIIIEKQKIEVVSLTRVKSNIKTLQEVKKFFEFVNENRENLFEMAGFKGALE